MALQDLAIILSAISSLFSLLGTLTTGVYAFAVLRTEVNQLKADNKHHWAHQADEGKHFNEKAFNEFERRMDERFVSLEGKERGQPIRYDIKASDGNDGTQAEL